MDVHVGMPHSDHMRATADNPWYSAYVLLVDDSVPFRAVAREMLARRGYLIAAEADCAVAAIEAATLLGPDLALVDVHLPDLSGFELTACLVRAYPALAVLLTSTDCDLAFYARAEACGARGFIPKSALARVELADFWPTSRACDQTA